MIELSIGKYNKREIKMVKERRKPKKRGSDIQGYPSGEFVLFKSRHTTQLEVFIWSISAWVIIFFIRLSISTVFSLSLILVVLFYTGFGLLFPGRPSFTAIYLYLIVSSISSCVKVVVFGWPTIMAILYMPVSLLSRSIIPF